MSANREMAAYARQQSEDEKIDPAFVIRKEENILAFLRYVFSWFRRKGTVQEPPNVPLFQQRLKGYQPLMTLTVATATFGVLACLLISIGISVFVDQAHIFQYSVQYGGKNNSRKNTLLGLDPFQYDRAQSCPSGECLISIDLPDYVLKEKSRVNVYFQLTGFHQNHRKYVASVCLPQLADSAKDRTYQQLLACLPEGDKSSIRPSGGNFSDNRILWPVGRIAKSFFTDHFELVEGGHMSEDDLVRPSVSQWFRNPEHYPTTLDNNTVYLFQEFSSSGYNLFSSGVTNPHFMAWMQPQAFPHFRKLFGTIDTPVNGTLVFRVRSGFDVTSFGGTKGLLVATESFMGARNPYLAPLLLSVGVIALLLTVATGSMRLFCNRKSGHPLGTLQRPQLNW